MTPAWRAVRRAVVAAGALVMAYAAAGALGDPDLNPVGVVLFAAAALVAHDAVVMPAAIGVGALIGRFVPLPARAPVRAAAVVSAVLVVVSAPLVLGLGRRPDDPSALPLPYGRNLAVVLLVVWSACLAGVLVRRLRPVRGGTRAGPVARRAAAPRRPGGTAGRR